MPLLQRQKPGLRAVVAGCIPPPKEPLEYICRYAYSSEPFCGLCDRSLRRGREWLQKENINCTAKGTPLHETYTM